MVDLLTLSFAGNTLRLLVTRGWEVTLWHSLLFNPALVRRGVVANPEEMGQVIANALRARGIRETGGAAVAFSGQGSISRILPLPPDRRLRLSEVVPREARRSMGVSLEENYLFWQPMPGKKRQVFVVAVPREAVRQLVETLKQAGLRPGLLDLAPLALARAANMPQAIAASVDAGLMEVAIIVDSTPVLVRTESLGEGLIGDGMASAVAGALSRTVSFYNDGHRERPLTGDIPLVLGGGQGDNAEVIEKVVKDIGHPLQRPALPFKFPADFTLAPFLVNLGMALKAL